MEGTEEAVLTCCDSGGWATIVKKRLVKPIVWTILGLLLLELLLRMGGGTYLFLKEHRALEDPTGDTSVILCLGESTTADGGVYSWPSQLERMLNEKNPERKFTVINEGIVGTNTAVILSKLEQNLGKYNPDVVITMMGGNDGTLYAEYEIASESWFVTRLKDLRLYRLSRFLQATLTNPLHPEPSSNVQLTSYQEEYRLKKMLEEFEEAIENNPNSGDAYVGLASTYKALEMYHEAIETYETLLELSKSGVVEDAWDEEAYTQLGWLYYTGPQPYSQLGQQHDSFRLRTAEEMFKKALEINPDNGDVYKGLGWVYVDLGINSDDASLFGEAEKMFRKSIESGVPYDQRPGFSTYEGLAWAYEGQGMRQEAVEVYENILELSGTGAIDKRLDEWAYAKLGRHYHETGVPDEEIEEFYRKGGLSLKVPRDATTYEITAHHYRELHKSLNRKGMGHIAMHYPSRDINELKNMFEGDENMAFVSNEENFRQALNEGKYEDYFIDRFAGDFGHATPKGNRLIAENVANAVLEMVEAGT